MHTTHPQFFQLFFNSLNAFSQKLCPPKNANVLYKTRVVNKFCDSFNRKKYFFFFRKILFFGICKMLKRKKYLKFLTAKRKNYLLTGCARPENGRAAPGQGWVARFVVSSNSGMKSTNPDQHRRRRGQPIYFCFGFLGHEFQKNWDLISPLCNFRTPIKRKI